MRNSYRVRFHAVGHPLAASVPFVVPLVGGLGSCCESPVSALSMGTGYFRRNSRGPRRWRGVGKCAGGNAGADSKESAQLPASKQRSRCAVCQLLDAFDENVGGVSAVQHTAVSRPHHLPDERLSGPGMPPLRPALACFVGLLALASRGPCSMLRFSLRGTQATSEGHGPWPRV
jgi:hypothetical protein